MGRLLKGVALFFIPMIVYLFLILATWRLSSLLVNEDGPFYLFERVRYLAGVRYDVETVQPIATNPLAGAFLCLWCMSIWVGLVWWALWLLWPALAVTLSGPFALSAGAILLDRWTNHA